MIVDSKGAATSVRGVERSLAGASTAADRLRATLVRAFAVLGGAVGFGAVVRTIAQFEQSMSTVQAVTGATTEQFRELNEEARRLGETTRFSATEAANAMTFLARAGFDTGEVLATIEGTLRLAQAGAIGLAEAADISSNVLTGFRLEVEQMARVVDVMALATNRSNQNIQQLGDALKFVGPVAAGLNADFEEIVAAIGALSDAGLQGSLAGTGLRRVLSELEAPAQKTLEIFKALGVSVNDVRPSVVGVTDAIERLARAGLDTGLALEVFGDRGGPAFEVLASNIPKVRELAAALKEAEGTAESMATIMDDNLNGALLRVRSALESVVLSFGELGSSSIITQSLNGVADALRFIAANMEETVQVAASFIGAFALPRLAAIAAGILGIGTATRGLAVALGVATAAAKVLGRALVIGFAIEGIQLAITHWDEIIETLERARNAVERTYAAFAEEIAIPAVAQVTGDVESAALAWADFENVLLGVYDILERDLVVPLFDLLTLDFTGFLGYLERLGGAFEALYDLLGRPLDLPFLDIEESAASVVGILDGLGETIAGIAGFLSDLDFSGFDRIGDALGQQIDGALASYQTLFADIGAGIDFLIEKWLEFIQTIVGVTAGVVSFRDTGIGRALEEAEELFDRIGQGIGDLFGGGAAAGSVDIWEGITEGAAEAETELEKLQRRFPALEDSMASTLRPLSEVGIQVASLSGSFGVMTDAIIPLTSAFDDFDIGGIGDELGSIPATVDAVSEALERQTQSFAAATGTTVDLANRYKEFQDALSDVRDDIDPVGKAAREFAEAQTTLNLALRTGNVDTAEATRLHQLLAETYRDQLDPLRALREEYEREISLGAVPVGNREVEARLRADILRLQEQGVKLTEAETNALRDLISETDRANRVRQLEAQIYRDLEDPVTIYARQMEALENVLADYPELAGRAAEKTREFRLALLDTQKTLEAGFERGLLRVFEEFNDHASRSEAAVRKVATSLNADPVRQYRLEMEALARILAQHPELAERAREAYEKIRLEFLDQRTDPLAGLERGAIRIGQEFSDVAKLVEGAFTDAFRGAEDALVKFVTTGKLEFGDLVDSIVEDIARIVIRQTITKPIADVISGVLKGSAGDGSGGGGLFGGLGSIFTGFLGGLGNIFGGGGQAGGWLSGLGSVFTDVGGGFLSALGGIFSGGANLFGSIFSSLFGGGQQGGGLFSGLLSGLGSLFGLGGGGGGFLGGLGNLFGLGGGSGGLLGGLGNLFGLGGSGGGFLSGLTSLFGGAGGGGLLGGLGGILGTSGGGFLAGLAPFLGPAAPLVAGLALFGGGDIGKVIGGAVDAAKNVVTGAIDAVGSLFGGGGGSFSSAQQELRAEITRALKGGTATAELLNQDLQVTSNVLHGVVQQLTTFSEGNALGPPDYSRLDEVITANAEVVAALNALEGDPGERYETLIRQVEMAAGITEEASAALRESISQGTATTESLSQNILLTNIVIRDLTASLQETSRTNARVADATLQGLRATQRTISSLPGQLASQFSDSVQRIRTAERERLPDLATGGFIRGPGTGTSDSILARISNGEYVVNAAATRLNIGLLDTINYGRQIPRFQSGGLVRSSGSPQIIVNDMRGADDPPVEIRQIRTAQGADAMEVTIRNRVREVLGSGEADDVLDRRYALRPAV